MMDKLKELKEKKWAKITGIVLKTLGIVVLIGFIIVVCLQRFSDNKISFFDYRMFTVVSGSMERSASGTSGGRRRRRRRDLSNPCEAERPGGARDRQWRGMRAAAARGSADDAPSGAAGGRRAGGRDGGDRGEGRRDRDQAAL